MQVEYDSSMRCFRIQAHPYGPVALVNYGAPFDSFEVVNGEQLVVYAYGGVAARYNSEGRPL